MREKTAIVIIILGFFLVCPNPARSDYKYAPSPKEDIYFGHVSYIEGPQGGNEPVVLREGNIIPEIAVLNFPLAPGDTIRTLDKKKCEIQFDTGTIIRLDLNTELKIETILARSLSSRSKISNFLLQNGQIYLMYNRYKPPEVFQIITPSAALKLNHKAVAVVKVQEDGRMDIQVKRGKIDVLYGSDPQNLKQKRIKKHEALTILKDQKLLFNEVTPDVEFELWNEAINKNFNELHEGVNILPKPIQKYPKAVFYFAQKYSSQHGEWVWNNLYGYVWRPHYNDHYPWGGWRPYLYGQWRELNGQLFWVPQESWGWVPYHLGLWTWDSKLGWLWIPGDAFAPAWATWDFFYGYYCWRPWFLWDWCYFYNPYTIGHYSELFYYGPFYDTYGRGYYQPGDSKGKEVIRKIRKDQLSQKKAPPYEVPKSLKKAYNNVVSALNRKDDRIAPALMKMPEQRIVVKREDLNAAQIHKKAVRVENIPKIQNNIAKSEKSMLEPRQQAARTYITNKIKNYVVNSYPEAGKAKANKIQTVPASIEKLQPGSFQTRYYSSGKNRLKENASAKGTVMTPEVQQKFPPKPGEINMRFRDWNPDVKIARQSGITIKYSSRTNEIRCPELRISSKGISSGRSIYRTGSISSRGIYSSGSGSYSSSSSSSSSTQGTRSSSSGTSGSSRSSGSGSSTRK